MSPETRELESLATFIDKANQNQEQIENIEINVFDKLVMMLYSVRKQVLRYLTSYQMKSYEIYRFKLSTWAKSQRYAQ